MRYALIDDGRRVEASELSPAARKKAEKWRRARVSSDELTRVLLQVVGPAEHGASFAELKKRWRNDTARELRQDELERRGDSLGVIELGIAGMMMHGGKGRVARHCRGRIKTRLTQALAAGAHEISRDLLRAFADFARNDSLDPLEIFVLLARGAPPDVAAIALGAFESAAERAEEKVSSMVRAGDRIVEAFTVHGWPDASWRASLGPVLHEIATKPHKGTSFYRRAREARALLQR